MYKLFLLLFAMFSTLLGSDYKYETGKTIYETTCISCHGDKGQGNAEMHLVVKPRKLNMSLLTQEQSEKIITKGGQYWGAYTDIMPAFEGVYTPEEIKAVTYYIHKAFEAKKVEKTVKKLLAEAKEVPADKKAKMEKRGAKIYKRNCAWCHGNDAKGKGPATTSPVDSIFPYDLTRTLLTQDQMFLYVKYGGHYWGTDKTDMPAWGNKYDDYTIRSVIKHIEETFRSK